MNAREFQDFVAHMEWADASTWRAARAVPAANTDDRLRYLFHHVHLVQHVYLQAWRRDPFVVTELTAYPDLDAVYVWAHPYYAKAAAFAASVNDERLAGAQTYPWAELIEKQFKVVRPTTMGESAWQVFAHSTYHRAQLATRIREIGGEPPTVDYLAWVWAGRPAPEW